LRRRSKRPLHTPADRTLLVSLAGRLRSWRHALLIIQPDTLLLGINLRGTSPGWSTP
jgi:hypothetical protein